MPTHCVLMRLLVMITYFVISPLGFKGRFQARVTLVLFVSITSKGSSPDGTEEPVLTKVGPLITQPPAVQASTWRAYVV